MGSHRARAQAPTLQLEEKALGPLPKAKTGPTITTEQAGRRPHQAPRHGAQLAPLGRAATRGSPPSSGPAIFPAAQPPK